MCECYEIKESIDTLKESIDNLKESIDSLTKIIRYESLKQYNTRTLDNVVRKLIRDNNIPYEDRSAIMDNLVELPHDMVFSYLDHNEKQNLQ
jgi:hypothetical protein